MMIIIITVMTMIMITVVDKIDINNEWHNCSDCDDVDGNGITDTSNLFKLIKGR